MGGGKFLKSPSKLRKFSKLGIKFLTNGFEIISIEKFNDFISYKNLLGVEKGAKIKINSICIESITNPFKYPPNKVIHPQMPINVKYFFSEFA